MNMSGSSFHLLVCAFFGTFLVLHVFATPQFAKRKSSNIAHHDVLKTIIRNRGIEHGRLEARKTKNKNQNAINKVSELDQASTFVGCSANPLDVTETTNIRSPQYPDYYPKDVVCKWNILARGDERIKIQFNSFDLEYHVSCNFDVLRIYAGSELYEVCGDQDDETYPPEQLIFPKEVKDVRLVFISDSTTVSSGFDLTVTVAENDACSGGIDMAEEGMIISPGYPHEYPNNANCEWRIHAPKNKVVKLIVEDFNVENQAFCSFDALEITGGNQTITGCGMYPDDNVLPDALAFPSNDVRIVFRSDASFNRPGFSLDVIFQDYCSDVPFLVTESGTVITSPGYPDNSYPINLNCVWNIRAPTGYAIDVKFDDFELEDHSACDYDYLEMQGIDPIPYKFCGSGSGANAAPSRQGFATNEINIRFFSDYSNSYRGFSLEVVFDEMDY